MRLGDPRVRYLAIAIFVLGGLIAGFAGFTEEGDGRPATLLGIPSNLLGPLVIGIGGALYLAHRRAWMDEP